MTLNNSILLILKQHKNIELNDLVAKFSSRYKNMATANAALSRSVKNLESFGYVKRKQTRLFITDKGLASIHFDMKERLLIRLNEAVKNPSKNIEEIVQLLIVLTQRASTNPDLLNNTKAGADFTIKDISNIQEKLKEHKKFIDRMSVLLKKQEDKLKELDFNDFKEMNFDDDFISKAIKLVGKEKLIASTNDSNLLKQLPQLWVKESLITVENEFLHKFFEILKESQLFELTIYLPEIKAVIQNGTVKCYGSHKIIKKI